MDLFGISQPHASTAQILYFIAYMYWILNFDLLVHCNPSFLLLNTKELRDTKVTIPGISYKGWP